VSGCTYIGHRPLDMQSEYRLDDIDLYYYHNHRYYLTGIVVSRGMIH